jgi:CheY-like chemotaxis protein/anti-sigma regulatory factor (Ser/Thr protein kinase)
MERLQELLSEALRHTRALMDDLSPPPALQQDDLAAALRWVVGSVERMGLRVTIEGGEEPLPLEREIITIVYQSVRELLQNVHKHAGTGQAVIAIERSGGVARVTVTDPGRGFEPAAALPRPGDEGGFGLFHLAERLDLVGGHFSLRSAPGEGTRAVIEVPLADERDAPPDAPTAAPGAVPPPARVGKIRVLLVDDHRVVREALRSVIEEQPDMTVVGEAADGPEAVEAARTLEPDVVLMDVSLPGMNGVEATHRIVSDAPHVRVVGLSMHDQETVWRALRDAGARAFVTKEDAFETLGNAIRSAARDGDPRGIAPTSEERPAPAAGEGAAGRR